MYFWVLNLSKSCISVQHPYFNVEQESIDKHIGNLQINYPLQPKLIGATLGATQVYS
jgi:hypothetical protein